MRQHTVRLQCCLWPISTVFTPILMAFQGLLLQFFFIKVVSFLSFPSFIISFLPPLIFLFLFVLSLLSHLSFSHFSLFHCFLFFLMGSIDFPVGRVNFENCRRAANHSPQDFFRWVVGEWLKCCLLFGLQ